MISARRRSSEIPVASLSAALGALENVDSGVIPEGVFPETRNHSLHDALEKRLPVGALSLSRLSTDSAVNVELWSGNNRPG
jgi:hypothetical protein